ncbi:MAG: ABC transporter permease [Clostridia bacterium]|nr:ABC transporter permease [Clostridia bacterium]
MRDTVKRILLLAGRNGKEIRRDPLSLLFMMAMPLFMEVLFYFLFASLTSQFQMRTLAPGIVVFAQSFLALFAGLLIAIDRGSSFLTRLYVSPARSFEFILGYAVSLLPFALAQSVLFFLVGGVLDPSLWSLRMLYAALISMIPAVFFIGLGILLGSVCSEKSIGGVASIAIAGQSMLSGMWFPMESLSGGMVTLMNVLPFRNATRLVQNTLSGAADGWADFGQPLLLVLGYTAVVLLLAALVFRHKMREK